MDNSLKRLVLLDELKERFRFSLNTDLKNKENLEEARKYYKMYANVYEQITNEKLPKSFEEYVDMMMN